MRTKGSWSNSVVTTLTSRVSTIVEHHSFSQGDDLTWEIGRQAQEEVFLWQYAPCAKHRVGAPARNAVPPCLICMEHCNPDERKRLLMTKHSDLTSFATTAIAGLIVAAGQIDQALFGQERHLNARVAEQTGPFAQAVRRLCTIAEGGPIEDLDAARGDLLLAFPQMRHLSGLYYAALQEVLFAAHLRCADLITLAEAEEIMGPHTGWLKLEAALGHIHLLVRSHEQAWQGYDATYLGEPGTWYEVRYAGYEIRAVRAKHDRQAEARSRMKAQQEAGSAA